MVSASRVVLLAGLAILESAVVGASPSHDECTQALEIGSGVVLVEVAGAGPSAAPDVWLRFEPSASASYFLLLQGMTPATVSVFTACPDDGGLEVATVEDPRVGNSLSFGAGPAAAQLLRVQALPGAVDVTLEIDRGASVTGRVTDDLGEPIGGASVELVGFGNDSGIDVDLTDGDGVFLFEDKPAGDYVAYARPSQARFDELLDRMYDGIPCPGPNYACDPVTAPADGIGLELGQELTGIDFELPRGGVIDGRVTANETGLPIEDVHVSDPSEGLQDRTDAQGRYRLSPFEPGQATVMARLDGQYIGEMWDDHACLPNTCRDVIGDPIEVEIGETTAGIHFGLQRLARGKIRGRVLHSVTRRPLDFVRVELWNADDLSQRVAMTESRGSTASFELEAPPGRYVLSTFGVRYQYLGLVWPDEPCLFDMFGGCDRSRGETLVLGDGQVLDGIDLLLDRGASITGVVTDRVSGLPIDWMWFGVWNAEGVELYRNTFSSNPSGQYGAHGLPPGEYFIAALPDPADPWIQEVWQGQLCPQGVGPECLPEQVGTSVTGLANANTRGIDFALTTRSGPELVVGDGRFRLDVTWSDGIGSRRVAQGRQLTRTSAAYWFFGEDNVEVLVKVLDACQSFDRFWVFAAGLTDLDVELTVTDLATLQSIRYHNPRGQVFETIRDTGAFDSCDQSLGRELQPSPGVAQLALLEPADPPVTDQALSTCVEDGQTLCVAGRFQVRAQWQSSADDGVATATRLGSDSGTFWFFSPQNVELMVKVLDACSLPAHNFWVFASGLTDVGVDLEIVDTVSGESQTFSTLPGEAFVPVLETGLFRTCDAAP